MGKYYYVLGGVNPKGDGEMGRWQSNNFRGSLVVALTLITLPGMSFAQCKAVEHPVVAEVEIVDLTLCANSIVSEVTKLRVAIGLKAKVCIDTPGKTLKCRRVKTRYA